jgi:hypothetical protein
VIILCVHCVRNFGYYRAGRRDQTLVFPSQFWGTVNANFLDIGVLEWCKLFTDPKDPHCWRNIVRDRAAFETGLCARLEITPAAFDAYCEKMKTYRDKFVAHLDSDLTMHPPRLDLAKEAVFFYHAHIQSSEPLDGLFVGLPADLQAYFESCTADALEVCKSETRG